MANPVFFIFCSLESRLSYLKDQDDIAEIRRVEIDEYGRVSGGLPGFFEHNIENILDYLTSLE